MTSDASNLPEHVPTTPIEGRVAPPFDDPVARFRVSTTGRELGTVRFPRPVSYRDV
jgi:hypothetical protein